MVLPKIFNSKNITAILTLVIFVHFFSPHFISESFQFPSNSIFNALCGTKDSYLATLHQHLLSKSQRGLFLYQNQTLFLSIATQPFFKCGNNSCIFILITPVCNLKTGQSQFAPHLDATITVFKNPDNIVLILDFLFINFVFYNIIGAMVAVFAHK